MLKLKKIQILGFKSFCDRTEVQVPGHGIAVVVGPNGCGKSNILDGVSWVLGEQSAKSLRGGKMEDVIFAGTRDRKPLGMAEVSLTLVDPEAYEGPLPLTPEIEIQDEMPPDLAGGDWNEEEVRAAKAAEAEEIIAEAQPGQVLDGEASEKPETVLDGTAHEVVLKIRRRKFQSTPQRGEIVISRRLFRTGDSEYLLNGKLCRLRDIQDIFMGTGLGPESYAIIGQERIGQLLSSKPHDRRAIIEEAAGITRFKTKKRLAELRLEQSKQNLARVNDIFEEVTKQVTSLKRQAAKAERYGALRDEMRARLRVVLASKVAAMDAEQLSLAEEIAALSTEIENHAAQVDALQGEYSTGTARGYALDISAKEASAKASQAAVELERAVSRQSSNEERIAELDSRTTAGLAELGQAKQHLDGLTAERDGQRAFLETAAADAAKFREQAQLKQQQVRDAAQAVGIAEQKLESGRRQAMHLLQQAAQARNQTAQAEEALAALEREASRLATEMASAHRDLDALGAERGQLSMNFESVSATLERLEQEIGELRIEIAAKRNEEAEAKRRGDQLRAEHATLSGRRNSLESLIRDHSYSTDTVRNLLRQNSLGGSLAPAGTLADFLEVDGQYEEVVDEFLRDELNYVVVKSWDSANEGMRLLKHDVDGRATFLVHPEDAQAKFSFAAGAAVGSYAVSDSYGPRGGVVRLKDCIRVLDGFGSSLEVILPKLREGYVTPDAEMARTLALENPNAFFLAPSGECFHNVTVTGGKPSVEGPLALKRELRDTQKKLETVEAELSAADVAAASLGKTIAELTRVSEAKSEERRNAERESANHTAALRQMDAEVRRLEGRAQQWTIENERNKDARRTKDEFITGKRDETRRLEAEHESAEAALGELQRSVEELRSARESAQNEASAVSAELAGLEERRRGAEMAFARIDRMYGDLAQRVHQLEQQLSAANAEREQRSRENEQLGVTREQLSQTREQALEEAARWSDEAKALRVSLAEIEDALKAARTQTEALRETKSERSAEAAKLTSDLQHIEESCVNDLGVEASALREDAGIARIEASSLPEEEEACRGLKHKLEAIGPVNMMALEEYQEASQRHEFLETQRKDLLDSIENTQSTIKEIDQISRTKFDEAFGKINENFGVTFGQLFGGGQAFMKLTDEENSIDSGIDIVASPPGKKLQNVLLLSGGEKALTALSLLIGIFRYQPSPFCVLDEVDAPLDESNVGRLAEMIKSMAATTQFVIVTHSKRMMQAADMIYGVTMQEPGVSKVVSVRLGGVESERGGRRGRGEQQLERSAGAQLATA